MRHPSRLAAVLGLLGCLAVSSPAAGQEPAQDPLPPVEEPDPEDVEAQRHFEAGRAYIDRGAFEDAAREFRVAHELSGRPELLFNMSLAYRDAGLLAEAIDTLERYLASDVVIADRSRLERRLDAMRADLAARQGPAGPSPWLVAGVVTAGVGALALIGALVTGILAMDAQSTLDSQFCDSAHACAPGYEATLDDARTYATTTDVLVGVGAGLVAVGAALFTIGLVTGNESAVAVACDADSCVASVRGSFP